MIKILVQRICHFSNGWNRHRIDNSYIPVQTEHLPKVGESMCFLLDRLDEGYWMTTAVEVIVFEKRALLVKTTNSQYKITGV